MNADQVNAAIAQSEKIVAMMTAQEKVWFFALDASAQFQVICAALAATA